VDVGISKLVRLVGDFDFVGDTKLVEELTDWKRKVRVNWFGRGISSWINELSDSTLCTGMGFSEIVPVKSLTDIHRLKTCRTEDFRFMRGKEGDITLGTYDANRFQPVPIEHMEWVSYLAFDQRDGHPQGYSLLYSLPFVSQIFIRMEKSWDNYTWRIGDPTFMTVVKGGEGQDSAVEVKGIAESISEQVTSIMQKRRVGQTGDLTGWIPHGGDVTVSMLGAEGKMLDFEIPIHTILEQIVAKTGLPPFMLGISWSTTERMSTHQADMIVSNVKWQRKRIEPIIEQAVNAYLTFQGKAGAEWGIEWHEVNLQDEVEQAKSRNLNSMAAEKEIGNIIMLMSMNLTSQEDAEEYLREHGLIKGIVPKNWFTSRMEKVLVERMAKGIYDI